MIILIYYIWIHNISCDIGKCVLRHLITEAQYYVLRHVINGGQYYFMAIEYEHIL